MTSAKKSIQHSHFNTEEVDEARRYDTYRESMGVIFDVSKPSVPRSNFFASIESYLLGEVMLVDCKTIAQRFERTTAMTARDGIDHYLVQLFLKGHTARRDGYDEVIGGDGKIIVIDASQPWVADNDDFENLTLVIPRRFLADKLVIGHDQHGRVIDTRQPFGKILADFMMSLHANVAKMGLCEAQSLVQPCTDLVAAAINEASGGDTSSQEPANTAQFTVMKIRIRQFIETHIANPGLSVEQVMYAFGMSRTQLYRLFVAEEGVATFIRTRRLDLSFKQVMIPPPQGRTISEIAYAFGFRSEAAFGRAFKQRFGVSPSEVRASTKEIGKMEEEARLLKGRIWEAWLQRL